MEQERRFQYNSFVRLHHVDGQSGTAVTSGGNEPSNQHVIVIQHTCNRCGAALEGSHSL